MIFDIFNHYLDIVHLNLLKFICTVSNKTVLGIVSPFDKEEGAELLDKPTVQDIFLRFLSRIS